MLAPELVEQWKVPRIAGILHLVPESGEGSQLEFPPSLFSVQEDIYNLLVKYLGAVRKLMDHWPTICLEPFPREASFCRSPL